jgi:hypothetical protein
MGQLVRCLYIAEKTKLVLRLINCTDVVIYQRIAFLLSIINLRIYTEGERGEYTPPLNRNQVTNTEMAVRNWKVLYKVGDAAALIMVIYGWITQIPMKLTKTSSERKVRSSTSKEFFIFKSH